ncbi:MAG: pyridoxal phosphate-dependent aminotransferase [Acidobacteria bacterium]|nr:pyridoxal phosphate-dependent aminotransferase [Acidobacteriota bacterium]
MISSRLPRDLAPNAVSRAVAARRASGAPVIDLTESNPTRVGIPYPPDLLAPLADPAALTYDPQPLGLPMAREAVTREYARQGLAIDPSRIALTASTSEAYALLFKLLCDPGDQVLVPEPSYPLFDHLTRLEGVATAPYQLEYHGTWRIDLPSVASALTPRSRALLVVSPNNPTGSFLHRDDLAALADLCAARDLVLIGDEVFADYALEPAPDAVSVLCQDLVPTCALGGLSKSGGLPQVKLGWMAWSGPAARVGEALHALEIIADSYLSVSTPIQVAAPALLPAVAVVRERIHQRVRRNLHALGEACANWPAVTRMRVEGGWSAVLQVPAVVTEQELIARLIGEDGVLVHPGYFFDFAREAFMVLSLIVEPEVFDRGVGLLLARAGGDQA